MSYRTIFIRKFQILNWDSGIRQLFSSLLKEVTSKFSGDR